MLDSVAFHFRHGFTDDYAKRSRMLAKMANTLTALARTQNLAVINKNIHKYNCQKYNNYDCTYDYNSYEQY